MPNRPSRRDVVAGSLALGAALASGGRANAQGRARIVLNDASKLSPTPVFSHWHARGGTEADMIAGLRRELAAAREERRPFAAGAARHSMGGQSIPRDGRAATLDVPAVELDRANRVFRVAAGTRWHQAIAALDPAGFSPAVMQSNSDFGVAATFSVNAHGWPAPYGPFGATVRGFRLMLADGTITRCSRTENAELFRLAMGGYGLVGVILDLDVDMVDNRLMQPRHEVMPAAEFARRFTGALAPGSDVGMIYGRLNVSRADFFQEALLITYRPVATPREGLPGIDRGGGLASRVLRDVYRAQVGSEAGKRARWLAERRLAPAIGSGRGTRNNLMNEPVANLENRDATRTDILHEYFVAPERFGDFLAACRAIIPRSRLEFLNVTLRYVRRDEDSVLSYATTDRIAAVMSFSQRLTPEDEAEMFRVTEELIDAMHGIGGAYYLPYRLHARREQFQAVYASHAAFAAAKRRLDPGLVFRNALWDGYLA
jgi:FAD/FMN-containing dehydrogenase